MDIKIIGGLIKEGKIKNLDEFYKFVPKRQLGILLGKEPINFTLKRANFPEKFTISEIKTISEFFNLDAKFIFNLLFNSLK